MYLTSRKVKLKPRKHAFLDAGGGYLFHVSNKAEQDYLVRCLDNHHYVQSIWLGLTDSTLDGATAEGKWAWLSGRIDSFKFVSTQS
ncbi:hypothetical protein DPMN_128900 [Dreissena polymorpha]|uniref:Uncharacterized protein n=1 Tax=Dreissena polymorpha TaxID=45954 RepID=A0A9D4K022_DREPO|nr:hypothetical protein DPMN_128900 [Dreissena polymorpha]